jgi:hypothetical protein
MWCIPQTDDFCCIKRVASGCLEASVTYSPYCVERLSGNSEYAPLRGPTILWNRTRGHHFGRFALPKNASSGPSGYFPDSLWKGNSQKFARVRGSVDCFWLVGDSEQEEDRHSGSGEDRRA